MTTNQIIAEIWKLTLTQTVKIAIYDDIILFCKFWPLWVLLLISFIILYIINN